MISLRTAFFVIILVVVVRVLYMLYNRTYLNEGELDMDNVADLVLDRAAPVSDRISDAAEYGPDANTMLGVNVGFMPTSSLAAMQMNSLPDAPTQSMAPGDLLPKTGYGTMFDEVSPGGQGSINMVNFVDAAQHIGVNTQVQSNRNPNLQLRSDPPLPKTYTGPFMASTVESDPWRRQFELGEGF